MREIQHQISKELFRNLAVELSGRLETPRKRAIAKRQLEILNCLLAVERMPLSELFKKISEYYKGLKTPSKAMVRDVLMLENLHAVQVEEKGERQLEVTVRLEWPTEITETEFFKKLKGMPKAKTLSFLH